MADRERIDVTGQPERYAFVDENLLLNEGASLPKVIDDVLDDVFWRRRAGGHPDDLGMRQPLVVQIREFADQMGRRPGSRGDVSQPA